MKRFTREGRTILRDGVRLFTVHRVGNDSQGYTLAPWETDAYTNLLCEMLNTRGPERVDAALTRYYNS